MPRSRARSPRKGSLRCDSGAAGWSAPPVWARTSGAATQAISSADEKTASLDMLPIMVDPGRACPARPAAAGLLLGLCLVRLLDVLPAVLELLLLLLREDAERHLHLALAEVHVQPV